MFLRISLNATKRDPDVAEMVKVPEMNDIGCPCDPICDVDKPANCACQSHSDFPNRFAYSAEVNKSD